MSHNILFFDIETKARPEAVALLPEPQAPANYKEPEKIAAYIADKRAEQLQSAALDPDTCEVVAISMRYYPEGETTVLMAGRDGDEREQIHQFWVAVANVHGYLCGWNILHYDLPVIQRRSMALGEKPYLMPCARKHQSEPVTDLFGLLFNWEKGKSLKTVAKLYGLHNPLPDLKGSMVAEMDDATLEAYAKNDVDLCVQLYERMAGIYFHPAVPLAQLQPDEFPF